jgi:hypothetical protein
MNGVLHRENGPAVLLISGTKQWYQYGRMHRADGPAHERFTGRLSWYINGVQYTQEQFQLNAFINSKHS